MPDVTFWWNPWPPAFGVTAVIVYLAWLIERRKRKK